MKKFLLFASLLFGTIALQAADFQVGDLYYNILDADAKTVEVAPPPSGAYQLSSASGYTFPDNVTYNGDTYSVVAIGVGAFKNAKFTSSNSNKVYPMMWLGNNVEEVKSEAFTGCTLNLTGFRAKLITVAPDAFKDNRLNWFNISGNTVFTSQDGVIFSQNNTHITIFGGVHCSSTTGGSGFVTSYTVPSNTVAVDPYCFSGNAKLITLNLGSSVQSIGQEACARMSALKTLTIPATATTIAADAFVGTTGITTLNVNLTEPVPGVVFDDAVYEACRDRVNFAANANIAAFQADPDWGKFFSVVYPKLYLAGSFTNWATDRLEMSCDNNGNYTLTVENVPNEAEFKFVSEDGTVWYGGETNDQTYRVHMGWCTDIALSASGQNFKVDGTGDLTFNVSNDMKLSITGWATGIYLVGNMTDWATNKEEMAIADGKFTITKEMAAGDEFKILDYNNNWYGATSSYVLDNDHLGVDLDVTTNGGAPNFKIDQAGIYVLSFDKDNMKLNVTVAPFDATPFQAGRLYYKPVSETEVEIIPDPSGVPYTIELDNPNELTAQVTNSANNKEYTVIGIGEGAFEDGSIRTKASYNTTARSTGYFFFPSTITYVSANAFKNVTSQLFGLRLGNITSIDNTAFLNNNICWFNVGMSGTVYKVSEESGNNGDNVGGLLYKEEEGVKTLLSFPGDRHRDYRKLKADGSNWVDNPNYVIATVADLSAYNVIGENAMYGNTNIKTLILGANLTAIEANAFKNVNTFTSITCNATVPPTGAVFEDAVIAACKDKLVVPAASIAAYRADENWGKFFSPVYEVVIAETEHGTVVADKEEAKEGDTVTLTITPAEGYELDELEVIAGADTPVQYTATETGATFVMPAEIVSVVATFKLADYAITIAEGIEHGTVISDKATANMGETVTLTATPAEGYMLETITVMNGETAVETTATETGATFVMPAAPVTVTATFAEIPTFAITVAETEHGIVIADKEEAEEGETVTLTVTPAEGYELGTLTVMNGETAVETTLDQETGKYTFVMPAAPVTVTATFDLIPFFAITVTEVERGTVVADKEEAEPGETITLTVTPAEGCELVELTVMKGETEVETTYNQETGKYTFVMPAAAVTVTATFLPLPVELDGVVFDGNTYASWYSDTDMSLPAGMIAYVVTGIENDVCQIEAVDYIPANVGVLLYSETGAESVSARPYTGETATVTSMLQGVLVDTEITNGYVLYDDAFVRTMSGTLAAHRCYLPVPGNAAGAPMRLRIVRNGDVVTSISDVRAAGEGNVRYIDINGRVSDKPFQGFNIVVNADGTVTKMVK